MSDLCPDCRPYGGCVSVGACPTEEARDWRERQISTHQQHIRWLEMQIYRRRQAIDELERP